MGTVSLSGDQHVSTNFGTCGWWPDLSSWIRRSHRAGPLHKSANSLDACGEQILQEAKEWNAELIVPCSHGRTGAERLLLGSDAEQVARHTAVPVLLVRQKDVDVMSGEHDGLGRRFGRCGGRV